MSPAPPQTAPEESPKLRRQLSTVDVALLVAGIIIGVGIFSTPGIVAANLSSKGWILVAWGLGGVIALSGALALGELGAAFPRAGGDYVYLRRCLGELPAFLYGWLFLTVSGTGSIAALAAAAGQYSGGLWSDTSGAGDRIPGVAVAAVLIIGLTAINIVGLRAGALVQNLLTGIKFATLLAVVVLGFAAPAPPVVETPPVEAASLWLGIPVAGLVLALVPICFTYMGWNAAGYVGGEVRDPGRRLPRGLLLGTGLVVVLYLLINGAYLHALTPAQMSGDMLVASSACTPILGERVHALISIMVLISILGGLNGMVLSQARVLYAMSRDGHFFKLFERIHPRLGTPVWALALQGAWALVLVATGTFEQLVSYTTFVMVAMGCLVVGSVFVVRRQAVVTEFRAPTAAVVIFLAASVLILVGVMRFAPINALVGLVMALVGCLVFFVWRAVR